jgi:predicted lipoprotein with Yx(FWY)xxD motif
MRCLCRPVALAAAFAASPIVAQPAQPAQPAQAGAAERSAAAERPSHPEEVALVDEGERGFVYRRFPGGQRLYTFELDPPGRSRCNAGCEGGWPPVPVGADAAEVGAWTIVRRHDGSRQWALQGRPVYTRFHDSPENPSGHGFHGQWRLVPYMPARDGTPFPTEARR